MRYLGIDYGKKRIGIALSDENGEFAMAHGVITNSGATEYGQLIEQIGGICREKNVSQIVLGESTDFAGRPNDIMKEMAVFKTELEKGLKLPIHMEPEFMTSAEAERIQGKTDKLDASAAALILKSYLDKKASRDGDKI